MAAKHWLVGCGIGCGAIVLLVIAIGFGGAMFVRGTMKGFNTAIESRQELEERFGKPGEFVPWSDGIIPPQRIETFLAVREALQPSRDAIVRSFSAIPMSEEEGRELDSKPLLEKLGSVAKIVGSAAGLGAELGKFFEVRNQAMLDQEIGMGEYTYIYVVVYFSWLGHDPHDGPENIHVDGVPDGADGRRDHDVDMGKFTSSRVREDLLSMLRNQLDSIPENTNDDLREQLVANIEAIESDRNRVPWEAGLPKRVAASLEPFRERLEATYSPATNPFELARNEKRGPVTISSD